jgi:hypothetical protein
MAKENEPSPAEAPPKPAGMYSEATEQVRDAAKWILASFAAVGAVFAAGLQLGDIGAVSYIIPSRLIATLAGLIFTVSGIVVAVWAVGDVILRRTVTLGDLINDADYAAEKTLIESDKDRFSPFQDLGDLRSQIEVLSREQNDQRKQYLDWDHKVKAIDRSLLQGSTADPALKTAREDARSTLNSARTAKANYESTLDRAKHAGSVRLRVLEVAGFMRVRRAFLESRGFIAGATVGAALGLVAFAWGSHAPQDSGLSTGEVLPRTPSKVTLLLLHPDKFRGQLGVDCETKGGLPAMAMTVSGDSYQVATEETPTCHSAWLTIRPEDGVVSPRVESTT